MIIRNFLYIVVVIFAVSCNNDIQKQIEDSDPEMLINTEIIKPFVWGESEDKSNNYLDFSGLDDTSKLHPLGLGGFTFNILRQGLLKGDSTKLKIGKFYIDYLINNYPFMMENDSMIVYYYGFSHGNFVSKEWYSGMANASIGLSFALAYDIFKEDKYLEVAKKCFTALTTPTSHGGCMLEFDDKQQWFLEYATEKMTKGDALYVLNGYLYQLLALKIYAKYTNDNKSEQNYQYGLKKYKANFRDYHYSNDKWTYYQLNPKVIESPHYAIFDIILLESLFNLTQDAFFKHELDYRREILRNQYSVLYKKIDKEKGVYLFSQIGPPHPYWIDLYPTRIIYDKKVSSLFNPRKQSIPIVNRAFSIDTLSNNQNISVYAHYYKDSVLLYHANTTKLQHISDEFPAPIYSFKMYSKHNAKLKDSTTLVFSNIENITSVNRAGMEIVFDSVIAINKYLGILINPEHRFSSIMIDITFSSGKSAFRYYTNRIKPNQNNLLLLSMEGFRNKNRQDSYSVSKVLVNFYSEPNPKMHPFQIQLNKVLLFDNNYQLYQYLNTNDDVYFPENISNGHLY